MCYVQKALFYSANTISTSNNLLAEKLIKARTIQLLIAMNQKYAVGTVPVWLAWVKCVQT